MKGLEGLPLGDYADKKEHQEKPQTETFEEEYKQVSVDRRSDDRIVKVRIRDGSGVTEFEVRTEDGAFRGGVDHEGRMDIDTIDDAGLMERHTEFLKKLISENRF